MTEYNDGYFFLGCSYHLHQYFVDELTEHLLVVVVEAGGISGICREEEEQRGVFVQIEKSVNQNPESVKS